MAAPNTAPTVDVTVRVEPGDGFWPSPVVTNSLDLGRPDRSDPPVPKDGVDGADAHSSDRKAADRFSAASDLDAIRQLNAVGIQPNSPLQPVARGLLDPHPDDDPPVWRQIQQIEARVGAPRRTRAEEMAPQAGNPRSPNEDLWIILAMIDDMKASMLRRRDILEDGTGRRRWWDRPAALIRHRDGSPG
jgi:hypothetical protein